MIAQRNRWSVGVVAVMGSLSAAPCLAAFEPVCLPSPYTAGVKTVIQEEAPADPRDGRALRTPEVRTRTEISRDGRVMIERSMDIDSPRQAILGMYPTTITEFDASGRMTSETQKANGTTPSRTTVCEYDNQGRLAKATTKYRVSGLDQVLTYAYGPSWRSERFVSRVAAILTTVTFDQTNKPVRQVRFDEIRRVELSVTDYRQTREGVEECVQRGDLRECGLNVHDARGNRIEYRSPKGSIRTVYRYDDVGNWINRMILGDSERASAVWRKITYW